MQQQGEKKVDPGECKLCGGHLSGNKSSFNCTTAQCVCVCEFVCGVQSAKSMCDCLPVFMCLRRRGEKNQ